MRTNPGRGGAMRARERITWGQLNAICRTTVTDDPSMAEWQGRIVDRILELGFALPEPATLHSAMKRNESLLPPMLPTLFEPPTRAEAELDEMTRNDPTRIPRPGRAVSARWATAGRALAIANACGCSKPILGARPLVCTREAGHMGDHGMATSPGAPPFVRWARSAGDPS